MVARRVFRLLLVVLVIVACGGSIPSAQHAQANATVTLAAVIPPVVEAPPNPLVEAGPVTAPVTLTAGDGTGLRLTKLKARGVVDDPLAFTELGFTFENPSERRLEGTFSITLPTGAAVSRFAMRIGEDWQEGEVVELERARVAYEDFLHRKQDPALLEQAPGNQFTARVFPIPAHGAKEIVISYSQEMRPGVPYALPLRGLPEIGDIDVELSVADPHAPVSRLQEHNYRPTGDLGIDPRAVTRRDAIRSGNLALVRVRPTTTTHPDPLSRVMVLVDTSASRVLGFDSELKVVSEIAKIAAHGEAKLTVACFDQDTVPIYSGEASAFGKSDLAKMHDRGALGASDIGQALAWARKHAGGATRLVLVSDGVATAGPTEGSDLSRVARELAGVGFERIDAVALGGIRDDAMLHRLTAAGLAHDGVVIEPSSDAAAFAHRLTESTRSVDVRVEGASFVWPRHLTGMQSGDDALVYAELPSDSLIRVGLSGEAATTVQAIPVERPLLERGWAQAKIASLFAQDGDHKQQIVKLSTSERVLTPLTGMLVLETDADYARFEIDRHALTDVMTVDQGKVAMHKRTDVHHPDDGTAAPMQKRAGTSADEEKSKSDQSADAPGTAVASAAPMEAQAEARANAAVPPPPPSATMSGPVVARHARPMAMVSSGQDVDAREQGPNKPAQTEPYEGRFKDVMTALAKHDVSGARASAEKWHTEAPGDQMALVALGEALEASEDWSRAARAYGSLIDMFPNRADVRRFAGERLERVKGGLDLALDAYQKAAAERPDHPSSHRLLAYALLKKGQPAAAFDAIVKGAARDYPRFPGVDRILHEDIGLIAAAWMKAEPLRKDEILAKVKEHKGVVESGPSLRFVLNWETDANDVDFHIYDAAGGHAFYSQKHLPSGGDLYADITTGYGPECFTIRLPRDKRSSTYTLQANYYSRGPMGFGMGKLEIIDHDGKGGLTFEERPYVVMVDHAFVDLGTIKR